MPKTPNRSYLYGTKCSFFLSNCKQILCITTFEFLCTNLRRSLHSTVVDSVIFAFLWNSKIWSIFEKRINIILQTNKKLEPKENWKNKYQVGNHHITIQFRQFGENKMERNLAIIFWTRKFWEIRAFDYSQHTILIMHAKARFHTIGSTPDLWTKLSQNYMKDKTFKEINIKIVVNML